MSPAPSRAPRPGVRLFLLKALLLASLPAGLCLGLFHAEAGFRAEAWPDEQRAAVLALEGAVPRGPLRVDRRVVEELFVPQLTRPVDILVLGSSAPALVDGSLFPGRSVHNAWMHYELYEDVLIGFERYLEAGKLPGTLVVALTPEMLQPVDQSRLEATSWKSYGERDAHIRALLGRPLPEAPSMLRSLTDSIQVRFSLARLRRELSARFLPPPPAAPAPARGLVEVEPPRPDEEQVARGIEHHRALFAKIFDAFTQLDAERLGLLDAFLGYLERHQLRVVVLLSPLHPELHHALARYPLLEETERAIRRVVAKHGAKLVGSFDPARAGCSAEQFDDGVHWRRPCAKTLLGAVAAPAQN